MENLRLEIFDNVVSVIEKLRDLPGSEVEIWIPEGSVLFENSLSLKLIKKEAEKFGKSLSFSTNDPTGQTLLDLVEGNNGGGMSIAEDFVPKEVALNDVVVSSGKRKNPFAGMKFPKGKKLWLGILGLVFLFGIYKVAVGAPKAEVVITVESQPLIKSIELEVGTAVKNDPKARTLEGKTFTASVSKTKTGATSGEALVGEKAGGKVKIKNYTLTDKDFDKGEELEAKDNNDLVYTLNDDVTVPAATTNPDSSRSPGTDEVDVTASDIGSDYNLDEGEDLEFKDHDASDYTAEVSKDIDGGKSETVKAVAQKDMDDLAAVLLEEMTGDAENALKGVIESGWVLIKGSESVLTATKEFNHKLDDQVDEIELIQAVNFQGLAYNQKALDELLDSLLDEFVPEGFELSKQNREVNVEILGNTDATTLSTTKSDLQVTLKSFILPQLDEAKIKSDLVGKKLSEAERILGGIRNVKSYEINTSFKIPFFSRMPGKPENITLTIKKD